MQRTRTNSNNKNNRSNSGILFQPLKISREWATLSYYLIWVNQQLL